jgi:hypothetical protein
LVVYGILRNHSSEILLYVQLVATFGTAEQKHYAAAGNIAEEVLSAIRTVVAFGGEHKEAER